jgi:putative holliday junction resolvase
MTKRWFGIDFGETRTGVAISDPLGSFAIPFRTLPGGRETLTPLVAAAQQEGIAGVVLGLPKNMDGTLGPAAEKVQQFAEQLHASLPEIEIVLWDERMTTLEAQKRLHEAGKNTRSSRKIIDQVAAQILLQNYLDAQTLHSESGSFS